MRIAVTGRGLDTRDWPQGQFCHRSNGNYYGPSPDGESLADYRKRVRGAYGTLKGITFHTLDGALA